MSSKHLIIRDEIHGDIRLEGIPRAVVDHPSFQRLRYIKQLGLAEYVFPSATHTRFQHSLGAAWLAQEYFESLTETWPSWDFAFEGKVGRTRFRAKETRDCLKAVAGHPASKEYWGTVATLSGMLHDVGHGPWSHTFEYLELPQDFRRQVSGLSGAARKYFDESEKTGNRIWHEDVSVLYVHRILQDLENSGEVKDALQFFLPIAALVNKRMLSDHGDAFVAELETVLANRGIEGGMKMVRLLSPLISGPFDVDRADYIQRDGRNCGVSLGGIEWRRIVRKLMPCLADHANDRKEPNDVVLVSHMKNQHVLDDFIFSLFQMYAQVYLHPKTVAFEEIIKRELAAKMPKHKPTVDFALHESLSDEAFRIWMEKEFKADGVRQTLFRQPGHRFQVVGLPVGKGKEAGLDKAGYWVVDTQDRPMMKDSVGVFLFSSAGEPGTGKGGAPIVVPWKAASPIADHFQSINHSSEVWIRSEADA